MGTIRPGGERRGGGYCPPGLLISQVPHRGGLFWLLASTRRVVGVVTQALPHPPRSVESVKSDLVLLILLFIT